VAELYNVAGLTRPALWAKGVKKWPLLAERGDAVAAGTTVGVKGGVFGVSAETDDKVKRY
jgi:hypothetical protein